MLKKSGLSRQSLHRFRPRQFQPSLRILRTASLQPLPLGSTSTMTSQGICFQRRTGNLGQDCKKSYNYRACSLAPSSGSLIYNVFGVWISACCLEQPQQALSVQLDCGVV
jgi:hypothetical protein